MITDSGQADHSSERSDAAAIVRSLLFLVGDVILRVFSVRTYSKGLWAVVGGAFCAPSKPGWESRSRRFPRRRHGPQPLRQSTPRGFGSDDRDRGSTRGLARAHCDRHHDDGAFGARRVAGSRMVGPLSVSRCARWMSRSQIASATDGSPMAACHAVGGSWLAISVEARSLRSSITPSRPGVPPR